MIYSYESIRAVHLELTDRCNAACPMCPRFIKGEEAPYIQNIQLSLDDIKNIFPTDFIKQLNRISFCGNYGDPIVARDLLPVIAYFRTINESIRIEVNTNGSARNVAWWESLAGLIGSDEQTSGVWFGLDGVGETNALYRRNTNWDIIMRNVKAFIASGGIAHWNFIVFKHNEHQIPLARAIAKEMGFKNFNVKLTARFRSNGSFPVYVKGNHLYDLEPPKKKDHQRPPPITYTEPRKEPTVRPSNAMIGAAEIIEKYRKEQGHVFKPVIPEPYIDCVAQKDSCIYVSAQGLVYPCCWVGGGHRYSDPQVNMDEDNINPTKRSIKEIIHGKEFQMISDSWSTGSIVLCVNNCTVLTIDDTFKQHGRDLVKYGRADDEK